MRQAAADDLDQIKAFLTDHIPTSMFPLSNLEKYGTGGHRHAMRFFVAEDFGRITGLLSLTEGGMIFPQLAITDFEEAAKEINGMKAIGIIGEASQVANLKAAIPQTIETTLDEVEPHFMLKLEDLKVPQIKDAKLVPLSDVDYDLMLDWRFAYDVEALNTDPAVARKVAERGIKQYLENDSHRVLLVDGVPVCTTGFNATTRTCVQVGGVFTPSGMRNNGYARVAVALHLAEARKFGATDAILFSSSEAAARAYMAIGFRQIGEFALMLFKEPTVIDV